MIGASGNVGSRVIEVLLANLDKYEIYGIAVGDNTSIIDKILSKTSLKMIVIKNEDTMHFYKRKYPNTLFMYSSMGLDYLASIKVDLFVNCLSGVRGLYYSYVAIKNKSNLALANKESLACGGKEFIDFVEKNKVKIYPIDSEIEGINLLLNKFKCYDKLYITCSGGMFYEKVDCTNISYEEAVNHPTWKMSKHITISCNLLANKGLELMEVYYLYKVDVSKIGVLLDKTSRIHAVLEINDKKYCVKYTPNMRIPIRSSLDVLNTNRIRLYKNELELVDINKHKMLALALDCIKLGGVMPFYYCLFNEIAIGKFIDKTIRFDEIFSYVKTKLSTITNKDMSIIERIEEVYKWGF